MSRLLVFCDVRLPVEPPLHPARAKTAPVLKRAPPASLHIGGQGRRVLPCTLCCVFAALQSPFLQRCTPLEIAAVFRIHGGVSNARRTFFPFEFWALWVLVTCTTAEGKLRRKVQRACLSSGWPRPTDSQPPHCQRCVCSLTALQ